MNIVFWLAYDALYFFTYRPMREAVVKNLSKLYFFLRNPLDKRSFSYYNRYKPNRNNKNTEEGGLQRNVKRDTRSEIILMGCNMFLEQGYSNASTKVICEELGISTGNFNFHFTKKEDLLAVLVEELCDFQWKLMEEEAQEGVNSLLAYCLELTSMVSASEQDENARDFFLSTYTIPITLNIIRKNDIEKMKKVFSPYCKGWSEDRFREAEDIVSGIEYAALMTTETSSPLEMRIELALTTIMRLYNVPEDMIQTKIKKVLSMDYRATGLRILQEFKEYINTKHEKALADFKKRRAKYLREKNKKK